MVRWKLSKGEAMANVSEKPKRIRASRSLAPLKGREGGDTPVAVAQGNGYAAVMPYDPHGIDDEPPDSGEQKGRRRAFKDFDCPTCSANNPYDDGFVDGDEVLCYYCGTEFRVTVTEEGRLRLREA
jgi:hypothetical protein